ncbi:MAG: hypothetical protein K2Q21_03170 [Chitinophagaceae bacterium]|nr:hypothetical protein [Chitinophagaceae bacterium]
MTAKLTMRSVFVTYLRLGYLLHLMTIAELLCIYALFQEFNLTSWAQGGHSVLKFFCIICLIFPPIFPQCDARSRYQNYKQVKDYLYLYGFQTRIIKPFSCSRCQRDAVLAAAEELGMQDQCKIFFKELGYRWYHILPDFLIHKPVYLFKKEFWLNTFFVKKYEARIDFKTLLKDVETKTITTNFEIRTVI